MKIVGRAGQQQFDANLARHVIRVVRQDAERCLTGKKQHIDSRTTFLSCLVVVRLCIFPFFFRDELSSVIYLYAWQLYLCSRCTERKVRDERSSLSILPFFWVINK
jgi:hypothetical protein